MQPAAPTRPHRAPAPLRPLLPQVREVVLAEIGRSMVQQRGVVRAMAKKLSPGATVTVLPISARKAE